MFRLPGGAAAMLAAALAAGGLAGCRPPLLAGGETSAAALAQAVVEALAARDEAQLRALAVSEDEFQETVWPELPAARPERNIPFAYAWSELRAKSDAGLERTLAEHGGAGVDVVNIRFTGGSTRYATFLVHRDAVMTVRRPGADVEQVRLFGSVLEKDGRFKVFSYVVD